MTAAWEREESPAAKDAMAQILINSRMYNTASLCGGTFGMYIPAVDDDQAVTGAYTNMGLLHQLRYSDDLSVGFRTNIGFVNGTGLETDFRWPMLHKEL